ncbi:hypothetical protein [Streptomyces sp. FXJ1.172]|uniref:hypothetical protein n=1 Tax=Streptomyces sp. FXJ1.172 TaxID=710705 RepID=UPI003FA6E755
MSVTVRVPAKVNVQLAVGAVRPDGFHGLASVFLLPDMKPRPEPGRPSAPAAHVPDSGTRRV